MRVTIVNSGTTPATGSFDVGVFDDVLANDPWDGPATDVLLGTSTVPGPLDIGERLNLDVMVPAVAPRFRDAPVQAVVDLADSVPEMVEINKITSLSAGCVQAPDPGLFALEVEWDWAGPRIDMEPMVGDINADGHAAWVQEFGEMWCSVRYRVRPRSCDSAPGRFAHGSFARLRLVSTLPAPNGT